MPRRPRELMDGGIYHIFSRGNNRKPLFEDGSDFEQFLSSVSQSRAFFPFELYHYCLMPNHFHLLLRIACGRNLPKLMRHIKLSYTRVL